MQTNEQIERVSEVTANFHRLLAERRLAKAAAIPTHDWVAEELLIKQWETAADHAALVRDW